MQERNERKWGYDTELLQRRENRIISFHLDHELPSVQPFSVSFALLQSTILTKFQGFIPTLLLHFFSHIYNQHSTHIFPFTLNSYW
jgi:hypothetical protein